MHTLRAGDDHTPPIVCVHLVTGRSDAYRELAANLTWPGSVLGLDAPAHGDTLTEIASHHADALGPKPNRSLLTAEAGPTAGPGPVRLLGWQLGGVIAAELARILLERGREVAFLGILDSRAPAPEMRQRPTDRTTLERAFANYARMMERPQSEADFETFIRLVRAFHHHDQRPIPMPLDLFESAEAHPNHPKPQTLGWEGLVPVLHRHVVAGTHFTLMAPARVRALADAITSSLR